MEQNRWKSPILWSSLVAQVLSILLLTGVIDAGLSETINSIVSMVLQIGVVIGVLNNPTDKTSW